MNTLGDLAHKHLCAFFEENNIPLMGHHKDVLRGFLSVLEDGLWGRLSSKYHLLALDPGMGKTQACVHFIKAWRERGFSPLGSILIGVSTIEELEAFVRAAQMSPSEFGVLTSNEAMNKLGLPKEEHGGARVLFTTQQMIRSRTKGKLLADVRELHYMGKPRSLRIWDETLLPSEGVVLRKDDVIRLASPLRPSQPEFIAALESMYDLLTFEKDGEVLRVPHALRLSEGQRYLARSAIPAGSDRDLFDKLQLMVGESMAVRADEHSGVALVGCTPTLPDDIVPLVIIDASGRVRTTYSLWEKHRGNLERLPNAHNSYEGLLVHLWNAPSGKDAVADPGTRRKYAEAIVQAFSRDPDGEWLILTYKEHRDALRVSIEKAAGSAKLPKLHWMHWGVHKSTNAYRDVENVVIVGQSTYRPMDYLGMVLAASGLPVTSHKKSDISDMRVGEYRHNLLQAVCRASVRKASGGVASRCNAFVITSQGDAKQVMEEVFPCCDVMKWKDDDLRTGRVAEAMAYIKTHLIDGGEMEVSKRDMREALKMTSQNLATNVLSIAAFKTYLAENQLEVTHSSIRQATCQFDEVE